MPSPPESTTDVQGWLPEIQAVKGDLGDLVEDVFTEDVPEYFWLVRASKNYHPVDHRGQHGLVIHVKRTFNAWLRVERMLKELSFIDSYEANIGRAAILLHDAFKYGKAEWADEGVLYHQYVDSEHRELMEGLPEYSDSEHGAICADFLDDKYDVPSELIACIRTHNGGFGDDRNPTTMLEIGHHLADAFGSDQRCLYRIYDPAGIFEDQLIQPSMRMGPEDGVEWLDEV